MEISATEPDWSRETPQGFWDPSRRLLRAIRGYQAAGDGVLGRLVRKRWALSHRFWSVITGADIDPNTRIGGGFVMPHPNGIVIHPDVVIGPNCLVMQQVTLGVIADSIYAPVIGGHVDIGAGAKVLGPVTVGNHARIGANAVVVREVPAGHVARGVPARAYPRQDVSKD